MKIFKKIAKRLILLLTFLSRLEKLETANFNRRFYAVEQIIQYLVGAKLEGDYLEFGVYNGGSFIHAYRWLAHLFPKMKFFAFDSFEGLPAPRGIDNQKGYTSNYHAHEFSCSEKEFVVNFKKAKIDRRRVKIVKGWFDQTLTAKKSENYGIKKAAFVWIDCDLYESTVPILKFITPYLVPGSVIVFDDWHAFRNDPNKGEQRACREWLRRNSKIKLAELFSYGYGGKVFTVTSC